MNTMATPERTPQAWYRELWPWLLMAGPAIVIVAGIYTAWLAVKSSDGLVTEDYYKQGLAAGETLERSKRAAELGITAGLRLTGDNVRIRLGSRAGAMAMPPVLHLTLSHPTRAGIDQKSLLKPANGEYVGELNLPASGHWLVLIEDEARTWRLLGSVVLPAAGETVIGGGDDATKPQS